MSAALRRGMTIDAFLEWETRQEQRWEFDGFEPVAMVGGTAGHSAIQRNLITALTIRLRGRPCQVHTSDLKILAASSVRYPDAFVVCSPIPRTTTLVTDPVVVFEILSPSTASTDLLVKNREYRDTPSIQRYVLLEQDRPGGLDFCRIRDQWFGRVPDADAILDMPELGIAVPVAEFYDGISFEDAAAG